MACFFMYNIYLCLLECICIFVKKTTKIAVYNRNEHILNLESTLKKIALSNKIKKCFSITHYKCCKNIPY